MNDNQNTATGPGATAALPGSLSGVRVLDMARVLAGPWAAQLLADLGADVIKLEHPQRGDDSRRWEPSFQSTSQPDVRQSAYFCSANRGKQSVTLDFSTPAGGDIVRRLVESSDVLIENYKTGTLARYGLSYEALAKINPRLIYCSVTGFGQTGPYRGRAGYDTIIQAMGGLMSLTGERDGVEGAGPQRAGLPVIDLMTGIYAALAITAALRHREATGQGQYIDMSLLDVQVSALSYFGMNYLASGEVPQRMGNTNPVTFPSGTYMSRDKQIVLLVGNDEQFRRFCGVLGMPALADDPRFTGSPLRVRNATALNAIIEPALRERDAATWMIELENVGVPCAPINDLRQVFEDPQVQARDAVRRIEHPAMGTIPMIANPIRMTGSPIRYDRAPPMLGESTDDVLSTLLGMSDAQIAELRDKKVV